MGSIFRVRPALIAPVAGTIALLQPQPEVNAQSFAAAPVTAHQTQPSVSEPRHTADRAAGRLFQNAVAEIGHAHLGMGAAEARNSRAGQAHPNLVSFILPDDCPGGFAECPPSIVDLTDDTNTLYWTGGGPPTQAEPNPTEITLQAGPTETGAQYAWSVTTGTDEVKLIDPSNSSNSGTSITTTGPDVNVLSEKVSVSQNDITISLTATDSEGHVATPSVQLTVLPATIPPPTITENGGSLWWFGQDIRPDEANYPTEATFTATDTAPSDQDTEYTWQIAAGQDEAVFSENNGSTIVTKKNTVKIKSISFSSIASGGADIQIQATFKNKKGTSAPSEPYLLTVRTPYMSVPNSGPNNSGNTSCEAASQAPNMGPLYVGFRCVIHYKLLDQFQDPIEGQSLAINEKFTELPTPDWTSPPQPAPETWSRKVKNCHFVDSRGIVVDVCFPQDPADWQDQMGAANRMGEPLTFYPPATPPGNPIAQKVLHWPGEWRFGDGHPGKGVLVQTNTWQEYQDRGLHCGITSPTDGTGTTESPCP